MECLFGTRRWLNVMAVIAIALGSAAGGVAAQEVDDATNDEAKRRSDERPNVVVIIADDLGYGETGMMGNDEIPTPNIDALAANGVRCTSGYVTASYCSASRAGFFTGRYQSRFGYEMNPTGKRNLLPQAGLPESETTFVSQLREAGYATGLFGKWHLGTVESKQPAQRGFDEFYGFLHEGHYYVAGPPYEGVLTMIRDTSLREDQRVRDGDVIRGNYAKMDEPKYDDDNPILRGDEETDLKKYLTDAITDEAVEFVNQNADKPFCMVVSYNAVHSPMQATTEDMETLRRIKDDQRRIFAGMLFALDHGIGRVRDALADHGLTRRTLVVFFSDNGGPTRELTSSNAPLRGGKGSLYEGGIRVPMIWSMPGRLPVGRVEDRAMISLDIAASALDLAGLNADPKMDGRSLLDWFDDPLSKHAHDQFFWRMSGGKIAYRAGNWKIIRPRRGQSFELYHLRGDMGETRDLASKHPEKLREMVNQCLGIEAEMPEPIALPRG